MSSPLNTEREMGLVSWERIRKQSGCHTFQIAQSLCRDRKIGLKRKFRSASKSKRPKSFPFPEWIAPKAYRTTLMVEFRFLRISSAGFQIASVL